MDSFLVDSGLHVRQMIPFYYLLTIFSRSGFGLVHMPADQRKVGDYFEQLLDSS